MISTNEIRRCNILRRVSDKSIVIVRAITRDKVNAGGTGWIEPIPLDEQWLVKFGASKRPNGYFIGKLKFTYEHNELSKFVRFHYSGKIAYLQYVHQLQNLYYALTGQELTIKEKKK